jgi:hypothetical protein
VHHFDVLSFCGRPETAGAIDAGAQIGLTLPSCTAYAVPGADEPPASFSISGMVSVSLQALLSRSEVCG